jgi:hypothetical protein
MAVLAASPDLASCRVVFHGLVSEIILSMPEEKVDEIKNELIAAIGNGDLKLG